ncbi:LysR family transcriptional regulator [Limimaricola pyoseonensis]|uniref:DNA-binding transcriptional regulator, LysR family n=1 Tax=Limimaricola pyoseonensis TaxID=521013 RepID=A0A1G7HNW4_9RHOB|nr:LysR family transcriptional regulator [Limimaricola pyoseonensis]SDF02131.1 DNA-binding transcriptional regulator, LysR family [Limimaricola pyoseonensis]
MRLEWLEDLVAVAETGSFSEAAERRALTQSAFSRRIRQIEEHVGVELFDRSRKPVQLQRTTAAQRERIVQIIAALRRLTADLRSGSQLIDNTVVLASQHALTTSRTPRLLQMVLARHEGLSVRLLSANFDECYGQLLSRRADIALVYRVEGIMPEVEADYLETAGIGRDRLIPVHAAARRAEHLADLAAGRLPIVCYPDEVFLGQVMTRLILPRLPETLQPVPRVETALTLAAQEMAQAGIGSAWIPESLARGRIAEAGLVDLSDTLPSCALSITAMRLTGPKRPAEEAVWAELVASAAAGEG